MDEDDRKGLPEGHKYDAPEDRDETRSKSVSYAVLGFLVILLMVLVATGVVPVFDM